MEEKDWAEAAPKASVEMSQEEWEADQQRMQAILADLIAQAQSLVPDPYNSPTRRAYRESPVGEIIAEKFRRQGFNLD